MLFSHLGEYACEWAYECTTAPIHNDRKKFVCVRRHSYRKTFVCVRRHFWGVGKHSRGLAKIRNVLLIFVRKAYSQHIREQS